MEILTTEDAQNHYEHITNEKLKNGERFGVDSLEGKRGYKKDENRIFVIFFIPKDLNNRNYLVVNNSEIRAKWES